MQVNPSIFREYDVRGIAGEKFSDKALKEYEKWYGKFPGITITPDVGEALGKAYGTVIKRKGGKKIIIGHEERLYGSELKKQFTNGVLSTGIDVDDAGVSLTPFIYFSTSYYGYDGGVNVTGSHNVYFFNGFKMMAKNVYPVYAEEIQEMKNIIENDNYIKDKQGILSTKNVLDDYSKYLLEHNKFDKKFKVVLDCGNGSAGLFGPEILRKLGCEVIEMYSEVDTSFPHHVPDPEDVYAMKELSERVVKEKADIGIAFDADGDRFGMVDENGEFIYADRVLLLHAKDVLSRNPGKKILYDIKCTRYFESLIPKYGGIPYMHMTGHAPIKATMRKDNDVILSGEISGHFYFAEEYFKIDDGLYSAARTLKLLAKIDKPASEIFKDIPKTSMTPEIKLPCADDKKVKIVEEIKNKFTDMLKSDFKIEKLSTKLQNWIDISWAEFTAELKKLKIELSGVLKDDWFDRFNRLGDDARRVDPLWLRSPWDMADAQRDDQQDHRHRAGGSVRRAPGREALRLTYPACRPSHDAGRHALRVYFLEFRHVRRLRAY